MTSFEKYLQKIHSLAFTSVLDDDLSEHFNNWLSQLDNQELLRYGQLYGEETFLEGFNSKQ